MEIDTSLPANLPNHLPAHLPTHLQDIRQNSADISLGVSGTFPQGHVSVNERVPNQRFSRYVDERVRDWIRDREIHDYPTEYEVAFYDEEALGEVSCLIVVQSGPQLWRAWESADDQRGALERSIDGLRVEDVQPVETYSAPPAKH